MSKRKTGTGKRMSNEPEEMVGEAVFVSSSLPVIELALDKIRVDETKNLRRFNPDTKSVEELAASIKTRGLLQPVVVRELTEAETNGSGETHELKAGYRRMQALRLNGAESVKATVLPGNAVGVIADKLVNLAENRERAELSYMDQAHAAKELLDAGMKKQDIAAAFGKSPAWATRILKFLELRPHIQKLIHDGEVPFRMAVIFPDLSEEKQDDKLAEIAEQKKSGGLSATEIVERASVKRKNRKKKTAKKVAAKAKKVAKKLVAKKLAADPRIKDGEKFKAIQLAVVKAHSALSDKVRKAKKKATAKDKALIPVLGALRGYLSGKPLSVFTAAVGKLL